MNACEDPVLQHGLAYERFMGRWSRLTGEQFIAWLGIPSQQRWLEVGCGTGAFTELILAACDPKTIVALDPSEQQLAYARRRVTDRRLDIRTGDAISIAAPNDAFDIAVAALVLNFVPDQETAVAEMARVVRPGGTVAVYVWDFAGGLNITQHLSDVLAAVAPDADRATRAAQNAASTQPGALADLFRSAGLANVDTRSLDITAQFEDFEDYWASNLTTIPSINIAAMASCSLRPDGINVLQQRLKDTLPAGADGKIAFAARAWAVRGTV